MPEKGYHVPRGSIPHGIVLFITASEQGSFKNVVFLDVWGDLLA
jgi:hypothetical protein